MEKVASLRGPRAHRGSGQRARDSARQAMFDAIEASDPQHAEDELRHGEEMYRDSAERSLNFARGELHKKQNWRGTIAGSDVALGGRLEKEQKRSGGGAPAWKSRSQQYRDSARQAMFDAIEASDPQHAEEEYRHGEESPRNLEHTLRDIASRGRTGMRKPPVRSKWRPAKMGGWDGLVAQIPKVMPDWSPKTFALVIGGAVGALPMALSHTPKAGSTVVAMVVGVTALDWILFGDEGTSGLHLNFAAGVIGGAIGTYLVRGAYLLSKHGV